MSMEGMDVEAAQAASRHLAGKTEALLRTCTTAMASVEQALWVGADRDEFVTQLTQDIGGLTHAAVTEIGRIVDELNDRIYRQQIVSNG